ncbi:hypothetical protein MNEG_2417 [Monoraphidium neglectum]|uniref:Uncharacterized protein n=1 Tax=Monoraphidium neglectum TaxID=145388 RepID=A0A0D2K538_9CHLO|nr:hypothetical protein MNEG_2417 [Monoraphidium neglectum]KIZ05548.1 hypothetical protein MNEG_2417 [Monoraphidium neglectum]|eukprot:XP_013904567.1 hypothetical protein MNEG_2417 [Monoraphidium neglectum]
MPSSSPRFQAYFNGEKVDELVGADPSKLKAMISKVAAMQGAQGTGQKVGGAGTSEPPAAGDDLRARMAAAAEARFKAQQGGAK